MTQHPIYSMPKQGDNSFMSFFHILPWWLIVVGCIVGYGVGRAGLKQTWTDIKSIYSWIRNFSSGAKNTITKDVTAIKQVSTTEPTQPVSPVVS